MNITDNLIRIKEGKDNIITALQNKGSDISNDTLIDNIPTYIDNLEIGGGGDTPSQPEIPELVQKYEGATVFRIEVPEDNYEFAINLCNDTTKATYDVDWGDGSLESGLTTDEQHHIYSKSGIYDVNVYNLSKNITLGGTTSINYFYTSNFGSDGYNLSTSTIYYLFCNTNKLLRTVKGVFNFNFVRLIDFLLGSKIQSFTNIDLIQQQKNLIYDLDNFYHCNSQNSYNIPTCKNLYINTTIYKDKYTNFSFPYTSLPMNIIDNTTQYNITEKYILDKSNTTIIKYLDLLNNVIDIPEGITKIQDLGKENSIVNILKLPSTLETIADNIYKFEGLTTIISYAMTAPTFTSTNNLFYNVGDRNMGLEKKLFIYKNAIDYETKWKTLIDEGFVIKYIEDELDEESTITIKYTTSNNKPIAPFKARETYLIDRTIENNIITETYKGGDFDLLGVFYGNAKLTSIEISNTCKYLGGNTFSNCSNLETVILPNSIIKFAGTNMFRGCTKLISVNIPELITSIPNQMFKSCSKLNNIVIPNLVTSIGTNAFYGCSSLQNIVIPDNVTTIGNQAFYQCYYLQSITCKAMTAPTIQSNTFNSVGTSVPSGTPKVLRVPEGAEGYDSGNWKTYVLDKGFTIEYVPISEL